MVTYIFEPNYKVVAEVNGFATTEEILKLNHLSLARLTRPIVEGTPLLKRIYDKIPPSFYKRAERIGMAVELQMTVNRFEKGTLVGDDLLHTDSLRPQDFIKEPLADLDNLPLYLLCSISDQREGVSNTEFLEENLELTCEDEETNNLVGNANSDKLLGMIQNHFRDKNPRIHHTKDGQLIQFDPRTIHRRQAGKTRGYRLFFRADMGYPAY